MDQDANSGAPQDPQSTLNDPQTRRKFLRTAVIGAAGVAGGAAVAGVVLSRQSPGLLTGQFALTNNLISIHDGNCAVCLTGSSYQGVDKNPSDSSHYLITVQSGGQPGSGTPGTLFFYFTAPGLTGGTGAGGTTYDLSFSYDTSKWDLNPGNPFYLDVYTNGTALTCPTNADHTGDISSVNKSCLDGAGCIFPYTVPQNQTQDVQTHVHMEWKNSIYPGLGVTVPYTFTFTLTTTGQTPSVCTGTITVDVKGV